MNAWCRIVHLGASNLCSLSREVSVGKFRLNEGNALMPLFGVDIR